MHFYLPVAEMSANILIFLAMGGAVGFLSGLFGVGGGFLMTSLLIFSGIPPAVAVGSVFGVLLVGSLRRLGLFDFFVAVCYVTFLGVIGTLMLIESVNTMRKMRG